MGRPRKKQRTTDEDDVPPESQTANAARRRPQLVDPADQHALDSLCPTPYTSYLKNHTPPPHAPFITTGSTYEDRTRSLAESSESTVSSTSPPTPLSNAPSGAYPSELALWPDYSHMLQLPAVVQDNHQKNSSFSSEHSLVDQPPYISGLSEELGILPSIPSCPCLPNLYLTLSTLSTLFSFPVGQHTIITLQTAARTAHSVLYCRICPQKFQTGMQNVMLLGTLLTVLADAWHRVRRLTADEIRTNFSNTSTRSRSNPTLATITDSSSSVVPLTLRERLEWLTFRHTLIRNNIFADADVPTPPDPSTSPLHPPTPDTALLTLLESMDRRQTHWHSPETATGEFPPRLGGSHQSQDEEHGNVGMTLAQIDELEKSVHDGTQRHFCLTLVDRTRAAVKALDGPMPVWGD